MSVIARDTVASDHLVYAWPFPIGPEEYEVSCADDEQVVICPSWVVGGLLGPGRHRYRSPNPMQPTAAYFVLTAPVEVSFDLATMFQLPQSGAPVRLRAVGSLQVRCSDPSLLIAQFVGLPFDAVNDGVLRSVARSAERMLARLLTRRVVMAGTAAAVTEPQMLGAIVEELVAYNPAAGAVFGVELVSIGHIAIAADDGRGHIDQMFPTHSPPPASVPRAPDGADRPMRGPEPETMRTLRGPAQRQSQPRTTDDGAVASGEISTRAGNARTTEDGAVASGEIGAKPAAKPVPPPPPPPPPPPVVEAAGTPPPLPRRTPTKPPPVELSDERTEPSNQQPQQPQQPQANGKREEARGAILGIGTGHIGASHEPAPVAASAASGEIAPKIAPGARVLVPGPGGLMQSATVRQLLQGYYELEVGGSDETIWVPVSGVVLEP